MVQSQQFTIASSAKFAIEWRYTGSTCFTPACFRPFCFNVPCQFTQVLNFHVVVFDLTPFGWGRTRTLLSMYETHGGRLCAHCKLRQSASPRGSFHTTNKNSHNVVVCFPLFDNYFYLHTPRWHIQRRNKKMILQCIMAAIILIVVIVCIWCVWVSTKACDIGFNHPWRRYGKSIIRDKRRSYEMGRKRKGVTTNDITRNVTDTLPTCTNCAQPKA